MSKRLFLAITPDPNTAFDIERWRQLNWPALERPTPPQNMHITLCFLGELGLESVRRIEAGMQELPDTPILIHLDDVGYWPEQEILYLGCSSPLPELQNLASACRQLANKTGVKVNKRAYVPHVTLARRCVEPGTPLIDPSFEVRADSISLYSSILDRNGARYVEETSIGLRQ